MLKNVDQCCLQEREKQLNTLFGGKDFVTLEATEMVLMQATCDTNFVNNRHWNYFM